MMCVVIICNEVALLQGIFALKSALLTLFWRCILHMLAEKIYNNYKNHKKKTIFRRANCTSMLLEFFACFTYIFKNFPFSRAKVTSTTFFQSSQFIHKHITCLTTNFINWTSLTDKVSVWAQICRPNSETTD